MALRPTGSIVLPTKPGIHSTTSTAAPASSPFSGAAPETKPAPVPDPTPTSAATLPVQHTAGDPSHTSAGEAPKETSKTIKGDGQNAWPLPPDTIVDKEDIPKTADALSILKSAQASAEAAQNAASRASDDPGHHTVGQQDSSEQAGHNLPDDTHHAEDSNNSGLPNDPGDPGHQSVSQQ